MSLIPGYATAEGTQAFAQKAVQSLDVSNDHYQMCTDGIVVSSIGMGSYIGEPTPEVDALMTDAVKQSIRSGAINLLDTAINYRFQTSERSYGNALKELIESGEYQRNQIFVCTKGGYLTPDGHLSEDPRSYFEREFLQPGVFTPEEVVGGIHCMTPKYLDNQLERSRKNLGLETIDLLYLHNAAESQLATIGREIFCQRLTQAFEFYEKARKENRIRYYGMASWDCFRCAPDEPSYFSIPEAVAIAEKVGGTNHGFRFIQLPYNLGFIEALGYANQAYNDEWYSVLSIAHKLGVYVFGSSPFYQAYLLQYDQQIPTFDGITSPAQRCLQFYRSTPGLLATIVGHKQAAHVADNCALAKVPKASQDTFMALLEPATP